MGMCGIRFRLNHSELAEIWAVSPAVIGCAHWGR